MNGLEASNSYLNTVTSERPSNTLRENVIILSTEQKKILQLVKSGENVFFTGPAGTGKSVLLREIIKELRLTTHDSNTIAITASTGIAGLNIGGSTVHSFAGIGLGKEDKEKLAKKINKSFRPKQRWCQTKTLIIDEISMVDGTLFDKLEYIARIVRINELPFGGIQLVLCGDFFQLPPVPDKSHNHSKPSVYAFDAKSWPKCIARPTFLNKVFRQKENTFIDILTNMRHGLLTASDIQHLQSLSRPLHYPDGIEPVQIFPLRRDVEGCNQIRLKSLRQPEHVYHAMDGAGYDVHGNPIPWDSAEALLDRMIALPVISLKIGAQIMLIQNIEQGILVNGSLGQVIDFLNVREARSRDIAIAEHPGQSNKKHDSLPAQLHEELRPLNHHVFTRTEVWPLVRFENGRELLCPPSHFNIEGFMGNVEARRIQVPLILAWALSVHKSQGQTLSRVKVDLGHTFEKGQAYVAISRATSMGGLEIQNFQPSKVLAHPRVISWHEFWLSFGEDEWLLDEFEFNPRLD